MHVLALDTTTRDGSVALVDEDGVIDERRGDGSRTHAERLPGELLALVSGVRPVAGRDRSVRRRVRAGLVHGTAHRHRHDSGARARNGAAVVAVSALDALAQCARIDGARGRHRRRVDGRAPTRGVLRALCRRRGFRGRVPDGRRSRVRRRRAREHARALGWRRSRPSRVVHRRRRCGATRAGLRERMPDAAVMPLPLLAGAIGRLARRRAARGEPCTRPRCSRSTFGAPTRRSRRRADHGDEIERAQRPCPRSMRSSRSRRRRSPTRGRARCTLAELENDGVSYCFLARIDTGEAVGFCSFWRVVDELHINNLAVLPAWRRTGVATSLLDHVMREGVRLGARRATLEVRRSNEPARRLYERFGFSVAGVRRAYYTHPVEDAIVLWREGLDERASLKHPGPYARFRHRRCTGE